MKNQLQNYFPMIRTQEEILEEIREKPELWSQYRGWKESYQQEYLEICSGVRGIKMLYDPFFKAIMNPDTRPERLSDFLSEVLGRKVKILKVLPNESGRIAAESSLLVMDIVIQFEDGSIANVEVQKIGYGFPGERSACYSADLLVRSINESGKNWEIPLPTEISGECIQSCYLRRVGEISTGFQRRLRFTGSVRKVIRGWSWICCRNIPSFALTFFVASSKIKTGKNGAGWTNGLYFYVRMTRK